MFSSHRLAHFLSSLSASISGGTVKLVDIKGQPLWLDRGEEYFVCWFVSFQPERSGRESAEEKSIGYLLDGMFKYCMPSSGKTIYLQ